MTWLPPCGKDILGDWKWYKKELLYCREVRQDQMGCRAVVWQIQLKWDTTFTELVLKYWFLLSKVLMKSFPLLVFKWSSNIFLNSSFLIGNSSDKFYFMQKPPWSVIIILPQGTVTQNSVNTCKLTMKK